VECKDPSGLCHLWVDGWDLKIFTEVFFITSLYNSYDILVIKMNDTQSNEFTSTSSDFGFTGFQ
jgi:hypothetical protein